jgi:hypothetical protein
MKLLVVLWSMRTTSSQATGFTPFFMVYGSKAILPIDLDYGAPRVRAYDDQGNQASLEDIIDQLEEHMMSPYSTLPNTSKLYTGITIATCGVRRSTSGT